MTLDYYPQLVQGAMNGRFPPPAEERAQIPSLGDVIIEFGDLRLSC